MDDLFRWVNWWTRPWEQAQHGWAPFDLASPAGTAICRGQHERVSQALGISPCLPVEPSPALLHLVLAPPAKRELMLALVDGIYHPQHELSLSPDQRQWCARLSRALPAVPHEPGNDPLHYLRAWVDQPIWQRLRLSFAPQRVDALEGIPAPPPGSKLDTVWQAVIWRATAPTNAAPTAGETHSNVVPLQD